MEISVHYDELTLLLAGYLKTRKFAWFAFRAPNMQLPDRRTDS